MISVLMTMAREYSIITFSFSNLLPLEIVVTQFLICLAFGWLNTDFALDVLMEV